MRRVAPVAAALALALGPSLGGVGGAASPTGPDVEMATSLANASGVWATLPMGHLRQPLNTFWQILVRPTGGATWRDVTSLGVATNGGLVAATSGGPRLVVATRGSNRLSFSVLAATTDAGRAWTQDPPLPDVAPVPDALAVDAAGDALALIGGGDRSTVRYLRAGAAQWVTWATESAIAATTAGRACGVTALSAVAFSGADALVGADCSRAGGPGLFVGSKGQWRRAPVSPGFTGATDVVALRVSAGRSVALVTTAGARGEHLGAAFGDAAGRWVVASGPALGAGSALSTAPDGAGLLALWSAQGVEHLEVVTPAGWSTLPAPPTGTQTVAAVPGGLEALTPSGSVLSVYTLDGRSWRLSQRLDVAIEYGSSG